jgi:hypothetical protein
MMAGGACGCTVVRESPEPPPTAAPTNRTTSSARSSAQVDATRAARPRRPPLRRGCHRGFPLAGVNTPLRLKLRSRCLTVRGIVGCIFVDHGDGDTHLALLPDPPYRKYLRPGNRAWTCASDQGPDDGPRMAIEVIPQHCVVRRDNCADLGHFTDPPIPPNGSHVTITGPWVQDTSHFNGATLWSEIHPAWRIVVG